MFCESLTNYTGGKLTCWRVVKFIADFNSEVSQGIKDTWHFSEIGYNEKYDNLYAAFENDCAYSEKFGFIFTDQDAEDYRFHSCSQIQQFIKRKAILEREVEEANNKLKEYITDQERVVADE